MMQVVRFARKGGVVNAVKSFSTVMDNAIKITFVDERVSSHINILPFLPTLLIIYCLCCRVVGELFLQLLDRVCWNALICTTLV
jgi:hypothetical protein